MTHFRYRSCVAAIVAAAFGLTTGALAQSQVPQTQSTSPPAASAGDDATTPSKQKSAGDASKQKMKHPPTAQMDQATPTEKATNDKPASAKHPPTSVMDKATPNEKSPNSQ